MVKPKKAPISTPQLEPVLIAAGSRNLGFVREYTGVLLPEYFTDGVCSWLWEQLVDEAGDPKRTRANIQQLVRKADDQGLIVASVETVLQSTRKVPVSEPEELGHMAGMVIRAGMHRYLLGRLTRYGKQLEDITSDRVLEEVAGDMMKDVSQVLTGSVTSKVERLGRYVDEVLEALGEGKQLLRFYPTQYERLNKRMGGGLYETGLTVFSARGGIGKSMFCLNLAYHQAFEKRLPTLYLDTEMTREQQLARLLALHTGERLGDIISGRVDKTDAFIEKARELRDAPLDYRSIAACPVEHGLAIIRRWYHTHDCSRGAVVVWDYLKMQISDANFGRNLAEFQSLGLKAQLLKDLAQELNVSMVVPVQLNRMGAVRGDSRDITDDETAFAGSDRVFWFADAAASFRPKTVDEAIRDTAEQGDMRLTVVKARNGIPHRWIEAGEGHEREYVSFFANYGIAKFIEGLELTEILDRNTSNRDFVESKGVDDGMVESIFGS